MRLQRNSQQLHQITTHKCGHLTITQILLTNSQYKFYHDIHHKNIHNVRISAAEPKLIFAILLHILFEKIDYRFSSNYEKIRCFTLKLKDKL